MNLVQLIGYLGAAPEIHEKDGTTWARFRLATKERWKDSEGNSRSETDWHTVVAFNGLARSLEALDKGDRVAVVGRLRVNTYEHEGETRTGVQVIARTVEFLQVRRFQDEAEEEAPE